MLGVALSDGSLATADVADLHSLRDGAVALACARTGGPLDPGQWAFYVPDMAYENTCDG
jgi:hypothetical protein